MGVLIAPSYQIAANTWVKLSPIAQNRYNPGTSKVSIGDPVSTSGPNGGRFYCGMAYGAGKIFYFGGGHTGYTGNDVELYDIASNVWTQEFTPELCAADDESCNATYGGATPTSITSNSRPWTHHVYQTQAYDPVHACFVGVYKPGTFAFYPASHDFTLLAPVPHVDQNNWPNGDNIATASVTWDPVLQKTLFFSIDYIGTAGVYVFDWDTATWSRRTGIGFDAASRDNHVCYDSTRQKHFLIYGDGTLTEAWWYDSSDNSWAQISGVPAGMIGSVSVAYDSRNQIVLCAGLGTADQTLDSMWALKSDNTWEEITPAGTAPTGTAAGRWGTVVYDSTRNVHFLVNPLAAGQTSETWAYRYAS